MTCQTSVGQDTSAIEIKHDLRPSFFTPDHQFNKGRFIGTSIGIGGAWAGSMIGLSEVWYSEIEKSPWNTFDDSKQWLQMDKVGHFYTAYKLNALTTEMYQWSGVQPKNAKWYGLGVSLGFQTTLEFLDAYTKEWGWSWGDFTANTLGAASYTVQSHFWNEERIIPKFSYSPTEFAEVRPNVLGSTFAESLLKDYNGQTYWLSFSPGTFFKESKIPKWACISFGYSAHEKLVGSESYYLDPATGREYFEQREFLISLDIDFSRIPVKRPWLRVLLKQLNYLKVPFPTFIIRDGNLIARSLYF
jgi:uncharacterized protein YfiM (DUF2279 family)